MKHYDDQERWEALMEEHENEEFAEFARQYDEVDEDFFVQMEIDIASHRAM